MTLKVIDDAATCENLKRILKERNIKPKDVQRALQLESVQAVYKWLSPQYNTKPSLENLVQLSHFLELDMEEILRFRVIEI